MLARGTPPERVRVFANTVDVPAWSERADRLAEGRAHFRWEGGFADHDVVMLSSGDSYSISGLDVLIRAVTAAGDSRLRLVFAGGSGRATALIKLAGQLDVRLLITGDLPGAALADEYIEADAFALLCVHGWGWSSTRPQRRGSRSFSQGVSARPGISFATERWFRRACGDVARCSA